ncbi:PPC domain-containing protein [Tundrisphaera lichenicola]|uniref:PPC domain-containing protein n=1 Tax=Tundrisphaera lichenicola TaxID=2029860 RepID=UPI003EC014ED
MNTTRLARTIFGTLLTLAFASATQGASPSLTGVRPLGGQRGTEVVVDLTGARLADAQEVFFYQPGISTTKLEVVADNHVKVTFKIDGDASLGLHDIRLRTATGVSELRTFSVGALKEVAEVEPNDEFLKPQKIEFGSVVNGVARSEDVDYFAFEAKKGDRITAEVEGARLGIALFDPYVAIMDSKRFELASSDDAALIWQDAFASVVAPEDGTYLIQVRESAYAGTDACLYRVHIGNYPRPTATVPAGGKFGETIDVRLIGDVLGEKTTKVTLPVEQSREFGIVATDDQGTAPYPNAFRLSPFGNVIEAEPNNDQATATRFEGSMALNGVIDKPEDVDHFVFPAKKGENYNIRVYARRLRSPLDSVLYIAKKGGGALAGDDDGGGSPDSSLKFTAPEDGEYVISIVDHLKKGGPDYFYRIEVANEVPLISMSVVTESLQRGAGASNLAVPRGNRQAILVNARRQAIGGALNIGFEGLPAGAELKADEMAANQPTMPVIVEAKLDAPIAGSLVRVDGKLADPKQEVPSEFRQISELVLGQNQVPYWTRSVDRLAVAVTEEAPYSIEVVEPKVPLVRGGSMNLKVVAKRKPGFTAAIAISLPWNPPGVGSSGGVAIPEKADEATIPMNADGGAEIRTWKIVVNGTASTDKGPIMVSSQLANLTVAAPFLSLAYSPASVEQGKETDLVVAVNKAVDFPGEATVTLIGLPNKVTTDIKTITKDTKEVVFRIKTDAVSPAGNHQNLFCQVAVVQEGEPILHNLGSGSLRIDVPLPPKPAPAAPVAAAAPAAAPVEAAPAPEKRLTRLEKLRLEARERAKAQP